MPRQFHHRRDVLRRDLPRSALPLFNYTTQHPLSQRRVFLLFLFIVCLFSCALLFILFLLFLLSALRARCVEISFPQGPHQPSHTDPRFIASFSSQRLASFPRKQVQKLLILPREFRQRSKVLHHATLKLLFQKRQQFLSNPRPHPRRIEVRLVLAPLLFLRPQIRSQLGSPHAQQRPHNAVRLWINSAKPRQSRPAQDMRQNCLRLVIRRMRHRHAIHFYFCNQLPEKFIPRPSPCILKIRSVALSPRRHVHALAVKG